MVSETVSRPVLSKSGSAADIDWWRWKNPAGHQHGHYNTLLRNKSRTVFLRSFLKVFCQRQWLLKLSSFFRFRFEIYVLRPTDPWWWRMCIVQFLLYLKLIRSRYGFPHFFISAWRGFSAVAIVNKLLPCRSHKSGEEIRIVRGCVEKLILWLLCGANKGA